MTFDIMTPDGRRAAAFLAIVGGCMVQTIYVAIVTYMLRGHADYLFWLAMAGNVLLFVGMTALGWAMGRRLMASASRDGLKIDDKGASE